MNEQGIEDNPKDEHEYCPVHKHFVNSHDRLCSKVDKILLLMLTNLGGVVLTLLTITGTLMYFLIKS